MDGDYRSIINVPLALLAPCLVASLVSFYLSLIGGRMDRVDRSIINVPLALLAPYLNAPRISFYLLFLKKICCPVVLLLMALSRPLRISCIVPSFISKISGVFVALLLLLITMKCILIVDVDC
jgi:hypothetical protein